MHDLRANKAVTRFEQIQHLNPNAFSLERISGDGRLGPLDLLVDEIPNFKGAVPPAGEFYARVLPELSASASVTKIKSKSGKLLGFKLAVAVADAGDAVQGATVSVKGHNAKTSKTGVAKPSFREHLKRAVLRRGSPDTQAVDWEIVTGSQYAGRQYVSRQSGDAALDRDSVHT